MTLIKIEGNTRLLRTELRAYINWQGRWRHVYILGSMDQVTIFGSKTRMLRFKTSKLSKETHMAEKTLFHQNRPSSNRRNKGIAA